MKANVSYKFKYGIYKFEYNGEKYVINSKWKYRDKLLDITKNKIVSIYNIT
jgi:hypothetical protein